MKRNNADSGEQLINQELPTHTFKITVTGMVQGVGFRPFIKKLANQLGISGTVRNTSGTVVIMCNINASDLETFKQLILSEKPQGSDIRGISAERSDVRTFLGFRIIESELGRYDEIIVPPDIATCDDCIHELFDEKNDRYLHPFISCAVCGSRYSIIKAVPFDRVRTAMDCFPLCDSCKQEYENNSRRCYAQTISCHGCGPQLLFLYDGVEYEKQNALIKALECLHNEEIIAVKSIGGYNYVCSADSPRALSALRHLKQREKKPFAVMFSRIESVKACCKVSAEEEALLVSPERPIVLLEKRTEQFAYELCKDSRFIGAFLPYTPIHHLLLKEFETLAVTSANLTDSPIITDDEEIKQISSELLSGILYHKREIVTPTDDSVARVVISQPQLIRRSRGYVPLPIRLSEFTSSDIFAAGGDMKSAFCLLKHDKAYMSQYFGDLEQAETNLLYLNTYKHLTNLLNCKPIFAVADMHPAYFSGEFAQALGIPVITVQHHAAHIYSVMAEHSLEQTIGVAFDGTGYGTDGAVWGSEFFVVKGTDYKHVAGLEYTKLCGGDLCTKDGKLLACCYLHAIGKEYGDERLPILRSALENNVNIQYTSSMGRLFDAVSTILGIRTFNSYEGECAVALENCAYEALVKNDKPCNFAFAIRERDNITIDVRSIISQIISAKDKSAGTGAIALGFHYAVADMICDVCCRIRKATGLDSIALSGGVFLNKLLLEKTYRLLIEKNFQVYMNRMVPTNDSGIALGQAYYASKKIREEQI